MFPFPFIPPLFFFHNFEYVNIQFCILCVCFQIFNIQQFNIRNRSFLVSFSFNLELVASTSNADLRFEGSFVESCNILPKKINITNIFLTKIYQWLLMFKSIMYNTPLISSDCSSNSILEQNRIVIQKLYIAIVNLFLFMYND